MTVFQSTLEAHVTTFAVRRFVMHCHLRGQRLYIQQWFLPLAFTHRLRRSWQKMYSKCFVISRWEMFELSNVWNKVVIHEPSLPATSGSLVDAHFIPNHNNVLEFVGNFQESCLIWVTGFHDHAQISSWHRWFSCSSSQCLGCPRH